MSEPDGRTPGRADDTVAHVLDMLRRRSLIIVAAVVACVALALAQRALSGDVYEASAEPKSVMTSESTTDGSDCGSKIGGSFAPSGV